MPPLVLVLPKLLELLFHDAALASEDRTTTPSFRSEMLVRDAVELREHAFECAWSYTPFT